MVAFKEESKDTSMFDSNNF